jgi:hypothetical protein
MSVVESCLKVNLPYKYPVVQSLYAVIFVSQYCPLKSHLYAGHLSSGSYVIARDYKKLLSQTLQ